MQLSPHPQPGVRNRAPVRGDVVRSRIIETAYRLFVEQGFADVSIEQIADAAGVSRRTVYNKFLNKDDIYRAAFEPVLTDLALAAKLEVSRSDDARKVLHDYAALIRELLLRQDVVQMLRVLVYEGSRQRWLAQAYVTRFRMPIRSRFRVDMARLIAAGKLPQRDVGQLSDQFFAMALGLLAFPRLLQLDGGSPPETGDALLRMAIDSLLDRWCTSA